MDIKMMPRDGFFVLGVLNHIDPMHTDYQAIWHEQVMPRKAELDALAGADGVMAAVFIPTEAPPPMIDMLAGMTVPAGATAPAGLTLREVPGGDFAVTETPLEKLGETWGYLYQHWSELTDRTIDFSKPSYEYYPSNEEGEMRALICIPVVG